MSCPALVFASGMDKTETADKRLFVHFHRRVYRQVLNELYASRRSTPFMNDEQRLRLQIAAAKGVTVAGFLLALVLADFRFRTGLDIDTATGRAALLLQQAGGSAKVIEEVDRLLDTRPVANPALSTLRNSTVTLRSRASMEPLVSMMTCQRVFGCAFLVTLSATPSYLGPAALSCSIVLMPDGMEPRTSCTLA